MLEGTSSTATAQHRELSFSIAAPGQVAVPQNQVGPGPLPSVEDQHKGKTHPEGEKPGKRAQLCKKLELRRSELRAQEQAKQKKLVADSAAASAQ